MADYQQLFQLGQQVQGRWQQLQATLATRQFEASAGGGMVRVTVDGRGTVLRLTIDPAVYAGRDAELLADLVLGALADAQRRAAEAAAAEAGRMPGVALPATP